MHACMHACMCMYRTLLGHTGPQLKHTRPHSSNVADETAPSCPARASAGAGRGGCGEAQSTAAEALTRRRSWGMLALLALCTHSRPRLSPGLHAGRGQRVRRGRRLGAVCARRRPRRRQQGRSGSNHTTLPPVRRPLLLLPPNSPATQFLTVAASGCRGEAQLDRARGWRLERVGGAAPDRASEPAPETLHPSCAITKAQESAQCNAHARPCTPAPQSPRHAARAGDDPPRARARRHLRLDGCTSSTPFVRGLS